MLAELIKEMHEKFELGYSGPPRQLTQEERKFRIAAMQEELNEYIEAGPLVEKYDALIDLLVFTLGTLYRHGFPINEGYEAVMNANMKKKIGSHAKRGHFKQDLVKPEDWVGPEMRLKAILNEMERTRG